MPKHTPPQEPEWERVLSAAAHLQRIFPDGYWSAAPLQRSLRIIVSRSMLIMY
jgi:hypothetical protein